MFSHPFALPSPPLEASQLVPYSTSSLVMAVTRTRGQKKKQRGGKVYKTELEIGNLEERNTEVSEKIEDQNEC